MRERVREREWQRVKEKVEGGLLNDNDYVLTLNYHKIGLHQGFEGIRQLPKNWCASPNDNTQIYPFCKLKIVVETFGHLT